MKISENPKYEKWNITSISHLSLTAMGVNGKEAQKRAYELLNGYIEWKYNNTYKTDGTLMGNPTTEYVKSIIKKTNENKLQKQKMTFFLFFFLF